MRKRKSIYKNLRLIAIVFVAIVVLAVAARAFVVPTIERIQLERAAEAEAESIDPEMAEIIQAQKKAGLSDKETQEVNAYSEDTLDVASLLMANNWVGEANDSYIEFGEGYFIEHSSTQEDNVSKFILRAVKVDTTPLGDTYTFSAMTSSGQQIGTITRELPKDGSKNKQDTKSYAFTLSSDAFTYSNTYSIENASSNFALSPINEQLKEFLGGEEAITDMTQSIQEWCAKRYPSASLAAWSGTAEIDYTAKTVLLEFQLDDLRNTKIYVQANNSGKKPVYLVGTNSNIGN